MAEVQEIHQLPNLDKRVSIMKHQGQLGDASLKLTMVQHFVRVSVLDCKDNFISSEFIVRTSFM